MFRAKRFSRPNSWPCLVLFRIALSKCRGEKKKEKKVKLFAFFIKIENSIKFFSFLFFFFFTLWKSNSEMNQTGSAVWPWKALCSEHDIRAKKKKLLCKLGSLLALRARSSVCFYCCWLFDRRKFKFWWDVPILSKIKCPRYKSAGARVHRASREACCRVPPSNKGEQPTKPTSRGGVGNTYIPSTYIPTKTRFL